MSWARLFSLESMQDHRACYAGDANGNTTRRSWDANGRLKSTVLADGAFNLNEYGPTGSLSRTIDYEGALISYGWDVTGALNSMSLPGGAQINFAYDISGTVRSIQKGADAITMTRDIRGAITRVDIASGRSITYTRDTSARIAGCRVKPALRSSMSTTARES